MTTRYLVDNYNFQTILWDSASFLAWAARFLWAKGWGVLGLMILAIAYGVVAGAPSLLAWGAVAVKVAVWAVVFAAFIVAVVLTGGWACRWVK